MKRALLASFAERYAKPDLRWMPDEGFTIGRLRIELLSGLTVALALVPEAVAFAFVAGVHPLVGLYAAFLVGLITALIGGRPGMISGATGALAVATYRKNFLDLQSANASIYNVKIYESSTKGGVIFSMEADFLDIENFNISKSTIVKNAIETDRKYRALTSKRQLF